LLLAVVLGAALALVPLTGGRLTALADVAVHRLGALFGAAGLQVLVLVVFPTAPAALLGAGHLASYLLAAWFVISNRHIPGWWLIGLGGLLNFAAIASNAGVMPASPVAVERAGLTEVPGRFANSQVLVDPNLAWLGDVFAVPSNWPLANVFSVGDVCLALGGAIALHGLCRSRLALVGLGEFTGLFSHRGFVRVWAAQGISSLGDWTYALAVATVLVERSGATHALAFLLVAQVGPAALTGLVGGPLVDRVPRRRVMIGSDLLRLAAVTSLLPVGRPSLIHLYAVAALLGIGEATFQPSVYASVPNLVPRHRIVAANSLVGGTYHAAVMLGPILGGILVAGLGLVPVLVINCVSFGASALLLSGVVLSGPAGVSSTSPVDDLKEGLRYSLGAPLVRGVLVVTGLVMFAAALRAPLEPLFVLRTLHLAPQALGLAGAVWGLGMVLGSAAAPAAARRWPRERLLAVGIAIVGAAVLSASQVVALSSLLVLWVCSGFGNALGTVSYESLLQERTPDAIRGRVMAASEAVLNLAYLAGASLAGWVGATAGVRTAYALSGGIFLLAAVASRVLLDEGAAAGGARPISAVVKARAA
jgi:MFS family permease